MLELEYSFFRAGVGSPESYIF